jgi:hypothetical protein
MAYCLEFNRPFILPINSLHYPLRIVRLGAVRWVLELVASIVTISVFCACAVPIAPNGLQSVFSGPEADGA